jgi:hypothetical protein
LADNSINCVVPLMLLMGHHSGPAAEANGDANVDTKAEGVEETSATATDASHK